MFGIEDLESEGGDCREVSSSSPAFWPAWIWKASSDASRSSFWRSSVENWIPDVKIMQCIRPYVAPGRIAWPCGKCDACRVNRRRIWTHRIMLEAAQHAENGFVTLTYDPKCEPVGLVPADLQGWIKRVRRGLGERKVRYYAVGEYGELAGRPHYHVALFGLGCGGGPFQLVRGGGRECRCLACSVVRGSWNYGAIKGHTMVGTLEEKSAAYIAGYVLKKLGSTWDDKCGLQRPFVRMSLKPGIGAGAIPDVASAVMQYNLEKKGDVPIGLRHGGSIMPLGRYLRRQLRAQCGLPEDCPEEVIEAYRQGLLPVFQYADAVSHGDSALWKASVQDAFEQVNDQANRNIAARSKRKGSI